MAGLEAVQISGLRDFQRALRSAGAKMPVAVRKAGLAAAEIIAAEARSQGQSLGGVAAKAAPSVRASAGATFAAIRAGGAAHPYFWGSEFGSIVYRQFKPWRGNGADAGYYVYPAIREKSPVATDLYWTGIESALREAYPS